jgi:hypothetical protein
MIARSLAVATLVLLAHASAGQDRPAAIPEREGPIPREYWGLHIHGALSVSTWPVEFGAWRLWDTKISAWPDLEPQPGQWRFDALDRYVDLAEQHGVEILLPLAMTPTWISARPGEPSWYGSGATAEPADLQLWREYVGTVARRYRGRVRHYEIWNEPNLKQFYTGSTATMVELARAAYTVLKAIDPAIVVVSPAATERGGVPWLEEYLRRGGAAYADVIGYHFYVAPGPPEDMVPFIQRVRQVLRRHGVSKPLWNTEVGWMIESRQAAVTPRGGQGLFSRAFSEEAAAAFLVRAFILNWALGVDRLYWYGWDTRLMGLLEPDGATLKLPGRAYEGVQRWLRAARVRGCEADSDQRWSCAITRGDGSPAWIVWSVKGPSELAIPAAWKVRRAHDVRGAARDVAPGERTAIGPLPILLEPEAGR